MHTEPAKIELSGPDWRVRMTVSVPKGPMRLQDFIPFLRTVSATITEATAGSAQIDGQKVSCKKGCGACCRQLVAISAVEAQSLAGLVAAMPAERQAAVRDRFAQAVRRLEEEGLLDRAESKGDRALLARDCGSRAASLQELARRYFRLQVPCPFLEDESCSIYEDRPMVCREYQVTSPAERCAKLFEEPVDRVETPVRLGDALTRAAGKINRMPAHSVPLVLALECAEAHGAALSQEHDGAATLCVLIEQIERGMAEALAAGQHE